MKVEKINMNPEFEIKKATEEDLSTVFSLVKGLAEHVNLTHEMSANEEDFKKYLFERKSSVEVLIGYLSSKPAALIIFYPFFSTFVGKPAIHIEDFYIQPEFRGMGLGTEIFKHMAKLALSRNFGKIEWYAAEWNENALRFYEKMGAEKLDKRKLHRLSTESMNNLLGGGC